MMKIKYIRLTAFVSVLFMILTLALPMSVNAADDRVSLTLICKKGDTILTGMDWRLYYVGQRSGDGYTLDGDFSGYSVTMEAASTESMNNAATILENYAIFDQISPIQKGEIDENGLLVFPELKSGLYMVSGDIFNVKEVFYQPAVSLVEIDTSADESNVDLIVYPKVEFALLSEKDLNNNVWKIWKDNKEKHEPITVEIYKNAELFRVVTLSDDNNWSYSWKTAEAAAWRVKESIVPNDYEVVYKSEDGNHVIENIFQGIEPTVTTTAPPEPILPQTGQLWWPVFIMGGCGFILIIIGIRINRKKME